MRASAMLISALMLCACATSGATPPILVGTEWLRVDEDNASPHYVTIGFTADGASGYFPGCGPWSARVRASDASLSFYDITPADPDCGAESSAAAAESMVQALRATRSAAFDGEYLLLRDGRGVEVARLRAN